MQITKYKINSERWYALMDSVYSIIESNDVQHQLQVICIEAAACLCIERINLVPNEVEPEANVESLEYKIAHNGMIAQHPATGWQLVATQPEQLSPIQSFLFQQFSEHLFHSMAIVQKLTSYQFQIDRLYKALFHLPFPLALFTFTEGVYFTNQEFEQLLKNDRQLGLTEGQLLWSQQPIIPWKNANEGQLDQCNYVHLNDIRLELHPCLPLLEQDLMSPRYFLIVQNSRIPTEHLATIPKHWFDLLIGQFGLSRKETILTFHLAQGWSVSQFAEHTCRSKQTVRAQLKAVYRKLALSSQKALSHWLCDQRIHWQLTQLARLSSLNPSAETEMRT